MKVNKEIMHFRNERARELEMVAKSLEKHVDTGISKPIIKAVTQLRDETFILPFKDRSIDRNTWGYHIENFSFKPDLPKHVNPKIKDLSITLNLKFIADCSDWDNLNDPLRELYFQVIVQGTGKKDYFFGFHIDRHEKEFVFGEEIHPVYHLQALINPNNETTFDYGSVLSIDTPRIMHYPMDFILGLGFLTANFYPLAYSILLDDGFFFNLYKEYQKRIWKPYCHTLALQWKPIDESSITWNPKLICPYFLD